MHPAPPIRAPRHARRAFTLIELGISSALMGVLMVSMASVVVLASKALPDPGSATEAGGANALALDQLMNELRCATKVETATAASLEFLIPDRDGDDQPETIQYKWNGAGNPLTRAYNGADAAPVSGPLQKFDLDYTRRKTTSTETTTTTWDSGEVLFSSFSGWSGLLANSNTQPLTSSTWACEAFAIDKLSFPAGVTRIAITRVSLQLRRANSPSGTTYTVAIHRPTSPGGSIPYSAPIGTPCALPVSALSPTSFAWVDATFSDAVLPSTSEREFCIVVKGTGTSAASIRYFSSLLAPLDAATYRYTTNSGGSWQPTSSLNTSDMIYFVYGSYQKESTATATVDKYFLASARATLQAAEHSSSRLDAGVEALNKPPMPAP